MDDQQDKGNDEEKLSPQLIEKFIDFQTAQLKTQEKEFELKQQEIGSSERISLKTIEYQAGYLKDHPKQLRLNYLVLGGIGVFVLLILICFIVELLKMGKDAIAEAVLLAITHLFVAWFSYRAGKKLGKSSNTQQEDFTQTKFEEIDS